MFPASQLTANLSETNPMPKLDHDTLELLLIAVTAICILFQTILLSAMFIAVRKGIASLTENVDELKASAMPVINHTRGFVERITPTVEATAKNVSEMSQTLKEQTTKVSASVSDIAQRVNAQSTRVDAMVSAQSTRVDAMVSGALDAIDRTAVLVVDAVNKPVRQLSGLLAGLKAVVEVLGSSKPVQHASHPPQRESHVPPPAAAQDFVPSGPADEFDAHSGAML
jgi:methyl-accepting chemotaxis protein